MRTLAVLMTVAALVIAAGAASAQTQPARNGARGPGAAAQERPDGDRQRLGDLNRLSGLDANNDGFIDRAEWPGSTEAFDRIDANRDGRLDPEEIAAARKAVDDHRKRFDAGAGGPGGPAGPNLGGPGGSGGGFGDPAPEAFLASGAFFSALDTDGDGKISQAELAAFNARMAAADLDGDGYISREEGREYFRRQMADRAGKRFMARFDADKDGQVTLAEFGGDAARFDMLDTDKDGVITSADFLQWGEMLGNTEALRDGRRQGKPGEPGRSGDPGRRGEQGRATEQDRNGESVPTLGQGPPSARDRSSAPGRPGDQPPTPRPRNATPRPNALRGSAPGLTPR